MKNITKFWFYSICAILFSCNTNSTENYNSTISVETPTFNSVDEVAMDNQIEANNILTEISKPKTSKSKFLYKEYYGGGFMDENGNLTIMVKGDTSVGAKIVGKNNNSAKIKYQKCKYSLSELNAVMDSITDYVRNNKNATSANLTLWFASEQNNVVEVYLLDTTQFAINDFRDKISKSSAIKFMQGEPFKEEKSLLYSGSKMSLGALEGATAQPAYGSFAFRARETSGQHRIGMVTAAHVISVGEYVYNWNDNIGTCTQSTLAGTVDAAFVVITDTANYDPSNYLYGDFSNLLSTSTSLPGTGTTVNKRGATTGHTSGYIVNTNAQSQASNGNLLTNLTLATYSSDSGDSGGIVYTYVSSTSTRYTVGVHRGSNGTYRMYSKAPNFLSTLSLERY